LTPHMDYAYCGNYEYRNCSLSRIVTPVGYYEGGHHHYLLNDYQGNVRCVVSDTLRLVSAVHYYPGGSLFGEDYGTPEDKPLFQGSRLESYGRHSFYDLLNRHYDPVLCRFTSIDKKSESYYPFSSYSYTLGNPIRFRDPTGLEPTGFESALMSGMAYHDGDYESYLGYLKETGWREVDSSSPLIEGYNFHGTLFMRQKADKSYEFAYAYPGTDSAKDIVDDIAQLVGLSPRYSLTINVATIISKRFNKFELTFLGHSMGGGEAAASSIKTGRKAITFNPAALSTTTRVRHGLTNDGDIINYITYKRNSNGSISMADAINVGQRMYDMSIPGQIIPIIIGNQGGIDAHKIRTIIEYLKP
ncbi:RHS repeat-associated core domain-containing protein, partial [uncultured Muribaculum sp.]|uniref:RHS repeat-associated core domain-containing protein n=1 Tax=uncultured Muribaculum sp. TaxID=1918613 RepID=UPI0025D46173